MNTVKTFFLMMVMSALLLLVGAMLGGVPGVIFALFLAIAMNFGAYWFSDRIALKMTHAIAITENDDPELYSIVREQASLAGLPMPKVFLIESESPNAFATGRNPAHATVAVTTGIRRILTREELAGVLAHEMAHVGNRDTLIMAMVATVAGAISMLAMFAQISAMFGGMGGRGRDNNFIGLLIVAIVMPIAAGMVRAAISRTREYQADATGAQNSGDPLALASALQKLELASQNRPLNVAEGASHLFIVNPLRGARMAKLFSTHPPMEERIRRLQNIRPNY
ncbi:MAG: zinc metalloprotease HtpX [Chloroflexi bacterium]|nr:zinc metalloprotease HtpX [Chloroflexota bacterium]MCH8800695.1 zinc metalloprotease HtpX [Chloroflexota bacterium]MCH8892012.1 zinc metalloprotease HtpX [Chloroflexota bacterium]MCI0810389.1 zinc metalloprotease HtpX [Chloroflexota bacterium]MCI0848232.1 zinc metalloprotease HtpX [Chloroflexota bacterium]